MTKNLDQRPPTHSEFEMAIIPAKVFDANGRKCPYCQVKDEDYVLDFININNYEKAIDVSECNECEGVYMVVESPALDNVPEAILAKWSVKDDAIQ